MLDYNNFQKLIIYLKSRIDKTWHSLHVNNVEYQNLFDEDDDDGIDLRETTINKNETYSDYEDILILDLKTKFKKCKDLHFRIKILFSYVNYLVYISYIPGDSKNLHNIISRSYSYWDNTVPGYLLHNHRDKKFQIGDVSQQNEHETSDKYVNVVKVINNVLEHVKILIQTGFSDKTCEPLI
tara:strand:- start:610 stop:1155 length:546 start_codon:yes stop_codon:yes gene_type:complete